MVIHKHPIKASEEIVDDAVMEPEVDDVVDEPEVEVAPEATDLLFEAEDVAELIAEVTGQPVEVTAEDNSVVFAVGDDEFTVEAEGNEEVLESVRKPMKGKKAIAASRTARNRGK